MSDVDLDQFCPTPLADPLWNESAYFSFSIPERGIHGIVYYFFRPNMNVVMGGPALWDGSGVHMWDCLFNDWHHIQPIPDDAEKFNFRSHTSLRVKKLKPQPLGQYQLNYDAQGFKLDLVWTAVAEPHHFLGMEIEATGASSDNRMHFEQIGHAKGTVELNGETLDVDCFALRDSSWGRRSIDTVKRGSYFWAVADENTAFHVQAMGDDPDQEVVGGFLRRGGITSTLVGGRRIDTVMGDLTPDSFRIEIEDRMGRTLEADCRARSHLMFNGLPRCQVVWSLFEADFGGGRTGWGDLQEFQPIEGFRQMVRGRLGA